MMKLRVVQTGMSLVLLPFGAEAGVWTDSCERDPAIIVGMPR